MQACLAGVVRNDAVGAHGQLARQLEPDGLHQWLLIVVSQHLGQPCRAQGKERACCQEWRRLAAVAFWRGLINSAAAQCAQPRVHVPHRWRTCGDVSMPAPPVLAAMGLEEGVSIGVKRLLCLRTRGRRCGARRRLQAEQPVNQALLVLLHPQRMIAAWGVHGWSGAA